MKKVSLMMLLALAAPVMAQTSLEQVIDKARKDGATIIQCNKGLCYNKDTLAPLNNPEAYKDSPDGLYIEFENPSEDAFKLLDEAARIAKQN